MRNYANEVLFMEIARAVQRIPRSQPVTSNRPLSPAANSTSTGRPVLRARWVLADDKLKLIWSEDCEEPLRRVA
jgi:hypothetical protein